MKYLGLIFCMAIVVFCNTKVHANAPVVAVAVAKPPRVVAVRATNTVVVQQNRRLFGGNTTIIRSRPNSVIIRTR
jgi:hypothetical protein